MACIQANNDELVAALQLKLEQAYVRLAERDDENASLREEVARLRQAMSLWHADPTYSLLTSVVECDWEHNG